MTIAAFAVALISTTLPLRGEARIGQPSVSSPEPGKETGPGPVRMALRAVHGLDGHGLGPLAEAMKIAPTDLTQLSARNNGVFPDEKVADVIRNGGAVLGHGSSSMLAWGRFFSELHKPEIANARIAALVSYLRSLQSNRPR